MRNRRDFENCPLIRSRLFTREQFDALRNGIRQRERFDISNEMKKVMFDDVGVSSAVKRDEGALDKVRVAGTLQACARDQDTGKIFNTELLNAWELGNLLDMAEVVAVCALNRKESRGGHSREDYPERDDRTGSSIPWPGRKDGKVKIEYKPVVTQNSAEGEFISEVAIAK
jgi:succinate dehydrogenase / fumarate reductase, flavoprotein subunit